MNFFGAVLLGAGSFRLVLIYLASVLWFISLPFNLFERVRQAESLLSANNLKTINKQDDLVGLDTYLQSLPMGFDYRLDRKSNAHGLVLGPPGSGKSALLNYLLMQLMAIHRPRVFIVEKGGSFY